MVFTNQLAISYIVWKKHLSYFWHANQIHKPNRYMSPFPSFVSPISSPTIFTNFTYYSPLILRSTVKRYFMLTFSSASLPIFIIMSHFYTFCNLFFIIYVNYFFFLFSCISWQCTQTNNSPPSDCPIVTIYTSVTKHVNHSNRAKIPDASSPIFLVYFF